MQVTGIGYLGTRTENFDAMAAFLQNVFGLSASYQDQGEADFYLANGDLVEVYGPGSRHFDFLAEHAAGPVANFLVDDVEMARTEIGNAGFELVGDVDSSKAWAWASFRAPDGHLYGVTAPLGGSQGLRARQI